MLSHNFPFNKVPKVKSCDEGFPSFCRIRPSGFASTPSFISSGNIYPLRIIFWKSKESNLRMSVCGPVQLITRATLMVFFLLTFSSFYFQCNKAILLECILNTSGKDFQFSLRDQILDLIVNVRWQTMSCNSPQMAHMRHETLFVF